MKRFIYLTLAMSLGQGLAHEADDKSHDNIKPAVLATVRIITGSLDAESGEFNGAGTGSGVVISPDGLVPTARHVVFNKNVRRARRGRHWRMPTTCACRRIA